MKTKEIVTAVMDFCARYECTPEEFFDALSNNVVGEEMSVQLKYNKDKLKTEREK
jgi:hypothetical protein